MAAAETDPKTLQAFTGVGNSPEKDRLSPGRSRGISNSGPAPVRLWRTTTWVTATGPALRTVPRKTNGRPGDSGATGSACVTSSNARVGRLQVPVVNAWIVSPDQVTVACALKSVVTEQANDSDKIGTSGQAGAAGT